jgi:hypothetical protein
MFGDSLLVELREEFQSESLSQSESSAVQIFGHRLLWRIIRFRLLFGCWWVVP